MIQRIFNDIEIDMGCGAISRDFSILRRIASRDLLETSIALLSDDDINRMSRDDLLETVRIAQTKRSAVEQRRIDDLDERSLRRVTFLLRRCLRIQLDRQSINRGWNPYFREQI